MKHPPGASSEDFDLFVICDLRTAINLLLLNIQRLTAGFLAHQLFKILKYGLYMSG